jgi:hypothetical protein
MRESNKNNKNRIILYFNIINIIYSFILFYLNSHFFFIFYFNINLYSITTFLVEIKKAIILLNKYNKIKKNRTEK